MLMNPNAETARVYLVSLWLCLTIIAQGMSEPSVLTNKNYTDLMSPSHTEMARISDDSKDAGKIDLEADSLAMSIPLFAPPPIREISISDPCSCRDNATTLTNGQFNETIEVEGPSGEVWTVSDNTGLFQTIVPNSSQATVLIPIGTILTETIISPTRSIYELVGVHTDAIGYSIEVTNGMDVLMQGNNCFYPNPMILDLSDYVCTQTPPIVLNGTADQPGTMMFTVDGVGSALFDPNALGDGVVEVVMVFDADGMPGPGITEPGCVQAVSQEVRIDEDPGVSCIKNINVGLQNSCEIEITVDMVQASDRCMSPGVYSIVLKDSSDVIVPGNIIRKVGTYYAEVTNDSTGTFCWGFVHAEDKIDPTIYCPNDTIIDCQVSKEPISTGMPIVMDNCNPVIKSYQDSLDLNVCGVGSIYRTWTATDCFSNTSTCQQVITVRELDAPSIDWPDDLTLNCGFDIVDLDPDSLSYPYNKPVFSADCRQLAEAYKEELYEICSPGSYKLFRYWTIRDWCDDNVVYRDTQLIKVIDTIPPSISCPLDLTLSTEHDRCYVDIPLTRAVGYDLCDDDPDYRREIRSVNGSLVTGNTLSPGMYEITHFLTDACNNEASCVQKVTVVDLVVPNVICDQNTNVSLTSVGYADICYTSIDDRSTDNCTIEDIQIRLEGEADSRYRDCITFDCSNLGVNKVYLRVIDIYGNENHCWANVFVEDKTPPRIVCPPDVSISCLRDYDDPENTGGYPTVLGNCTNLMPEYNDVYDNTTCPSKIITRTWSVEKVHAGHDGVIGTVDDIVMADECDQIITVVDSTGVDIEWPEDLIIPCTDNAISLAPADLVRYNRAPVFYDNPKITGQDCEHIGVTITDKKFDLCGPESYKIRRVWHIVDWCSDLDTTYIQTIWVRDDVRPDLVVDDIIVDITANVPACEAYVSLNGYATDNCTQVHVSNDSRYAISRGADASGIYPKGTSVVTFTASDACGNVTHKSVNVTVRDAKAPVALCGSGFAINLKSNGVATVCAETFDRGSNDNCTFIENLQFYIRRNDELGNPIGNPQECITFTCTEFADNSLQSIEFIVEDAEGNQASCNSFLVLQDNSDACRGNSNNPTLAFIQGQVNMEDGSMVDNINVYLDNQMVEAQADGVFLIDSLQTGHQYSLNVEREGMASEGVNTLDLIMIRRHMLQLNLMSSPYQLLAADVNADDKINTLDLIEIRQMILRMIQDFSGGYNWRFVASDYVFPEPENPWSESLPEIRTFQLNEDLSHLDFTSIKMGDVNQSVMFTNNTTRTADQVSLVSQDINLEKGQIQRVAISVDNSFEYLGAQFLLSFDKDFIDAVTLQESIVKNKDMAIFESDDFINVVCTWINESNEPDLQGFIELDLMVSNDANLSKVMSLRSNIIRNEVYPNMDSSIDLKLSFEMDKDEVQDNEDYKLYQNTPNPFAGSTNISFEIPISNWVELHVFDLSGKMVWNRRGYFNPGMHSVPIHEKDLKEKGLLIYKITSGSFSDSKRMIILE